MKTNKKIIFLVGILQISSCCSSKIESDSKNTEKKFFQDSLAEDSKSLFKQIGLKVSKKGNLLDPKCGEIDPPQIDSVDLNHDKVNEVFVLWGNTCTSGMVGTSIALFIRDSNGAYHKNLDFAAAGYEVLKSRNKDFPDLKILGRGFCFPVWRWNGTNYKFLKNISERSGACAEKTN